MSFGCYVSVGSGAGTITCQASNYNSFSSSSSIYMGYTGYGYGNGDTFVFTATPASGYTFSNFVIYIDLSNEAYSNGTRAQTYSSSTLTLSDSYVSNGQSFLVEANFTYTGSSSGGSTTTTYYYAYYNTSTGSYILGPYSTTSSSISASSLSGYTYNGYIYHSSFDACISQYTSSSVDSTSYTCTSHSSSLPYVLFFYTPTATSTYTYYTAGYDLTNGTYLYGPYTHTSAATSLSATASTLSGYTYNGYVYHGSWSSCISQANNGSFDGTGTTGTCSSGYPYLMFFYTPASSYTLNLTFNIDGGTWNGPTSISNISSSSSTYVLDMSSYSHPTKEGYSFVHWKGSNGSYYTGKADTWTFSNLVSGTNNITFTAIWVGKNTDCSPKHIRVKDEVSSSHTRLRYIKFTGTQYIDTGYKPNQKTTITMKLLDASASADTWVPFGTGSSDTDVYFAVMRQASATNLELWYCKDYGTTYISNEWIDFRSNICSITVDNDRMLTCKLKYCNFDNGQVPIWTVKSSQTEIVGFTAGYSLYLMACHGQNGAANISKGYIYSCQIWENDELVRNLIPVKRSDGVICFYDKVNDTYYLNAGTGDLVAGPEQWYNDNSTELIVNLQEDDMLRDYEVVNAVIATTNSYIDTGFKPNNNTKVEIKFLTYLDSSATQAGIFGARTGYQSNAFSVWTADNGYGWQDDYYNTTNKWDTSTKTIGSIHTIIKDKNSLYADGELKGTTTATTFQCDYNMFIGGVNNGGSYASTWPFFGYIFYAKIWDNDTLIRDYVPVRQKDTIVYGLYDKVNKEFYASAGSADLSALRGIAYNPGDVYKAYVKTEALSGPTGYPILEYITIHNDIAYVDTGFKPNQNTSVLFINECDECNGNGLFGTDKFHVYTNGSVAFSFGGTTYGGLGASQLMGARNEIILSGSDLKGTCYGRTGASSSISFSAATFESGSNLYLFKCNENSWLNPFYGKFYRCKIWDNGTLVRDYVPIDASADGTGYVGVYDLVNKTKSIFGGEAGPERSQWRLIK